MVNYWILGIYPLPFKMQKSASFSAVLVSNTNSVIIQAATEIGATKFQFN